MSAIALSWVASIRVGNQTAKQLLHFYAAQGFNDYYFKVITLAEQLECSESSIQRAHKLLIEKRLIIKEDRYDENGRQLSNIYKLNITQSFVDNYFREGVTQLPIGVSHRHGEGVTQTPLYNNNINNNKNKSLCANALPLAQDRFEDFWKMYPKKKDKKRTNQIWTKNKLYQKQDEIISNLTKQCVHDAQWQSDQFIPHPSTYLHGERWKDEIVKPENEKPKNRYSHLPDWTEERLMREKMERENAKDAHGCDLALHQSRGNDMRKIKSYLS